MTESSSVAESRRWKPAQEVGPRDALTWWVRLPNAKSFHAGVLELDSVVTRCGRWLPRAKAMVVPASAAPQWSALPTFCRRCYGGR